MSEINILPFVNSVKDHVENSAIHGGTGSLVKIGEITAETLNNNEPHTYVKLQYPERIPEGQYLSKIVFKVFEPFENTSGETISDIDLEPKPFINALNNISMAKLNTNNRDIDIAINLSATNQLAWNAGNIGVFASFLPIPDLVEASRLFTLTVIDENSDPLPGADVFINDELMGQTNEDGIFIHAVTCEEIDLMIQKEGYNNIIQDIESGILPYNLGRTMSQSQPETRSLSLTVNDTNQNPVPGAEVFIADISIGYTDNNGLITHDVPADQFSIGIVKNNLTFTPEVIEAGTDPIEISRELSRYLIVHVHDALQNPIAGVSVYVDESLLGVTNAQGTFPSALINASATALRLSKTHFFNYTQTIDADFSYNISTDLNPSRHLNITVKDIMNAPIQNVTVKVGQVIAGYTNSEGVFETDITTGATEVDILKTGYIEIDTPVEQGTEDITATPVMQYAPEMRNLNITVQDADSNPIVGANIYIGYNTLLGTTNLSGYLSAEIGQNSYMLSIRKQGYYFSPDYIESGSEDVIITRQMEAGRGLALSVLGLNAQPLANALISVNNAGIGLTDETGVLTLNVPSAEFTLKIEKSGYIFTPEIIEAGIIDLTLSKSMVQSRTLNLTVTDEAENPVNGANVLVDDVIVGSTNPMGMFSGAVTNSAFNLGIEKTGFYFETESMPGDTDPLTVSKSMIPIRMLTLNVKNDLGVNIFMANVKIDGVSRGNTNINGNLVIPVTLNQFGLIIEKSNYYFADDIIPEGLIDISYDAQMSPLRNLTITVYDSQEIPQPVAGASIYDEFTMNLMGTTSPLGIFNGMIPKPIDFNLLIEKENFFNLQSLIIAGDDDVVYTLSLTPSRNLTITVTDEEDNPVENAQIIFNYDNITGFTDLMGIASCKVPIDPFILSIEGSNRTFTPENITEETNPLTLSKVLHPGRFMDLWITEVPSIPVINAIIKIDDVIIGHSITPYGSIGKFVSTNQFNLKVEKADYSPYLETIEAGVEPLSLTVPLVPFRNITLTVNDSQEVPEPVAGASVYNGETLLGTTSPLGIFNGKISTLIETVLTIQKQHFFNASLTVPAGNDDVDDTITMTPSRLLILLVTDTDSNPLANAHVKQLKGIVETSLGYTSPTGQLTASVSVDEFTLKIEKDGYGYIPETIEAGILDLTVTKQMMALRTLVLLVTDNTMPDHLPLPGVSVNIGDFHLGDTGPTGYLNTSIPQTETTIHASLADYITQELIIDAGIVEVDESIALVPAGE